MFSGIQFPVAMLTLGLTQLLRICSETNTYSKYFATSKSKSALILEENNGGLSNINTMTVHIKIMQHQNNASVSLSETLYWLIIIFLLSGVWYFEF